MGGKIGSFGTKRMSLPKRQGSEIKNGESFTIDDSYYSGEGHINKSGIINQSGSNKSPHSIKPKGSQGGRLSKSKESVNYPIKN